jgi:hypothetical protein
MADAIPASTDGAVVAPTIALHVLLLTVLLLLPLLPSTHAEP